MANDKAKSVEALYPALFAPPAPRGPQPELSLRSGSAIKPEAMRLMQWAMRQAAKTPPSANRR